MQLEEFEEVRRWLNNVKEGSKPSYRAGLRLFCEWCNLNPSELLDEAEEDRKKSRRERGKEMEKVDFNPYRPHALRAAFSSILRLNGFDPVLVDFMRGHSIPYNGAYLIPPPEEVRKKYAEVEPQLSITAADVGEIEKRFDERLKAYKSVLDDLQNENRLLRSRVEKLEDEIKLANELFAEIAEKPVSFHVSFIRKLFNYLP